MSAENHEHHGHQEHLSSSETLNTSHEAHKHLEHAKNTTEKAEHDSLEQSVNAIRARAEREAKSAKEFSKHEVDSSPRQSFMLHRELKDEAYRHTLQKVRRHLSTSERAFSKVIHQPGIDAASEVAAKTVGRASGLFAGSLFALIGSAFLLYTTKKYGFTYNYGVFILCFLGGFALGLLVELIWRTIRRNR